MDDHGWLAALAATVAVPVGVGYGVTLAARRWVRSGAVLLACGLPAVGLIAAARRRRGERLGPVGLSEWANLLGGYLAFCVVLAVTAGVIIRLGESPGQFR